MKAPPLFMLALMPPPRISGEIRMIQEAFAREYDCKAGLKNRVHITLILPFRADAVGEAALLEALPAWAARSSAFTVQLQHFRSFRRNGVIFIDVVVDAALERFQDRLERELKRLLPGVDLKSHKPYHPHITIGYRDIPRHRFQEAETAYLARTFAAAFPADRFYLWKHNGAAWEIYRTFHLGAGTPVPATGM